MLGLCNPIVSTREAFVPVRDSPLPLPRLGDSAPAPSSEGMDLSLGPGLLVGDLYLACEGESEGETDGGLDGAREWDFGSLEV